MTISTDGELREYILHAELPPDIKRSVYYDCVRGYSWEVANEEWLNAPPKRHPHTPPFTLVLPDGEGLTITGELYQGMRHAVDNRRRRERARAEADTSHRENQERQRNRYSVAQTGARRIKSRAMPRRAS